MNKEMSIGRFEGLCRRSGLVPVTRAEHPKGTIYIGEGFVDFNEAENIVAHWCVIWAVLHSGIDMAKRFPMSIGSSQAERTAEALKQANEFLGQWHNGVAA